MHFLGNPTQIALFCDSNRGLKSTHFLAIFASIFDRFSDPYF